MTAFQLRARIATLILSGALCLSTSIVLSALQETSTDEASWKKNELSYEDRKAWRRVLRWPESCEEAFDYPDKSFAGLRFYGLGADKYLVEVTCTLGAYQGFQMYFYLDETGPIPASRLLTFQTYESTGKDGAPLERKRTSELWGTPQFDSKTKQLRVLNRFRGLGDCGFLATYGFRGDGSAVLKDVRAKLNCDGKASEDPTQWKSVPVR